MECQVLHLDYLTNGWQSSDLVIVAARPSMGKTAFVLSMARSISIEHQIPVAFFSLEMSSVQLVNRLISGECEINANKLRSGNLEDWEWQKLEQRLKTLGNLNCLLMIQLLFQYLNCVENVVV